MRTALCFLFLSCSLLRAGTFTHQPTNLHFPDRVGKWQKVLVHQLPYERGGIEIGYKGPRGSAASFCVYNRGLAKISTGAENDTVKRELANSQAGMLSEMQKRYHDVGKIFDSNPDVTHNGRKATFLATAINFRESGAKRRPAVTYILLTGYKNHFLKLFFTEGYDKDADIAKGLPDLRDVVMAFLGENADNSEAFWMR